MERQAVAQGECPVQPVIRHLPAIHHLRLRGIVGIDREQRIIDKIGVVARDIGGGEHRIQHRQVGLRHEAQRRRVGRGGDTRRGKRNRARRRTGDGSKKVLPVERPQRAGLLRLDRRRPWDISQQCDLTEEVAGTERHAV